MEASSPEPFRAGGQDILISAGTFGDISRYLQGSPGVVGTSDFSNEMLVRGGHPMENLFLLDGIEVPNMNHLATAGSTGGFAPMIDSAAIQDVQFSTSGFGARYPGRLSSVTEFHTLDNPAGRSHTEMDFGVQGAGGLEELRVKGGDLLVSAHHGLVNLISEDVGIGGVPSYTNGLTRFSRRSASGDSFTALSMGGVDSIAIVPCASDDAETSTIDWNYDGWRETTGAAWQHVYSAHAFGVISVSDSEQVEGIHEEDQVPDPLSVTPAHVACPIPANSVHALRVYREDSNQAFSTAKYDATLATAGMSITAGSAIWLQRPRYDVEQPAGAFSPYVETMTRADSASFNSNFSTGESGSYADVEFHLGKNLSVSTAGRLQTFAFGNHVTVSPNLGASYRLGEQARVRVAYAEYAQLPPYSYLLSYPVNRALKPMRARHESVGLELGLRRAAQVRVEAYAKSYGAIPAATEYPSVTIHTTIDMIGAETVWLPMATGGHGEASGIELSDSTRIGSRIMVQGSVACARARFAGTDGILRPSNFDLPWIVNAAGVHRIGRGITASSRYAYTSGRPYTPFNMAASLAQNRPIFDLSKVNALRAPYYSRLDVQINKEIRVGRPLLELYCGVDNVINRSNFLSYAWMPRSRGADPVGTLWQTPIFPNFGIRLILR